MKTQVMDHSETLIDMANQAAEQGHWMACFELLEQAFNLEPENPGILTGMGTSLLRLDQPDEAFRMFEKAAEILPISPETQNNLGVAAYLVGKFELARAAYRKAVDLDPDYLDAWKNLAVINLQGGFLSEGIEILAAIVQSHPEDVDALSLLAGCYAEGDDTDSARYLYQKILAIDPENQAAQTALATLPATRIDSDRIARPEHAKKLAALKGLARKSSSTDAGDGRDANGMKPSLNSVALYAPAQPGSERRISSLAHHLDQPGYKVKLTATFQQLDLNAHDVFVFANPHIDVGLAEGVHSACQAGKKVIVDLDQDFYRIPRYNNDFSVAGPGNPQALDTLSELLKLDLLVSAPSAELAKRYKQRCKRSIYIPHRLDHDNPLWTKPGSPRKDVQVGLLGMYTSLKDASLIVQDLTKALQDFPGMLLTIGGNYQLIELFNQVPEDRKLFIPSGSAQDHPYLLSNFDIVLLPLLDNRYNASLSDLPLREAGLRQIPWIGSSIPAYQDWVEGGILIQNNRGWYGALKTLLEDGKLRNEFGAKGKAKYQQATDPAQELLTWL